MKLRDCVHGIIVQDSDNNVGMIVGITNNVTLADIKGRSKPENAIALVQWSHGKTTGIHPGNIEKL